MSGPDAFLSRWSRRKLEESARPEETSEQPPELISPEPPAELPSLDDVTPESNLTAFLAENVPAALRNAALRKAWSLDPAIRDYIGDARDYAWDWNVPDGVPGFGPIAASYDVEGTIARMWAGPPEEEPALDASGPIEEAPPEPVGDALIAAREDRAAPEGSEMAAEEPEPVRLSSQADAAESGDAPQPRRKHGGATPT